jgi:2-amino-4-hydroxy-6-hydroxymethyldihydropteridine diphosphokinase
MNTVLSLGGNVGNVIDAISHAAGVLPQYGLSNVKLSPLYRTLPIGCEPGTPDFINAVIVGDWSGSPEELLRLCHKLETEAGRPEGRAKNSPRVLDVDIILCRNEARKDPELILPHPLAVKRLFVMQPLCDVAPKAVFPDSGLPADVLLRQLRVSLSEQEQVIEQINQGAF